MMLRERFHIKRLAKGWMQTGRRVVRRARKFVAPEIADVYLPSMEQLNARMTVQAPWSDAFNARLESIQCSPQSRCRDVHLTFAPIGRNLRLVGTRLYQNSRRGVQSIIVPGNPEEERVLAERGSQRWLGIGRGPWKPWLWSRIPRGQLHNVGKDVDDVELGWQLYFRALNTKSLDMPEPSAAAPPVPPPRRKTRKILALAQSHDYAFRLSPEMQQTIEAAKDEMGWELGRRTLGIHLRRGDAVSENLNHVTRRASLWTRTCREPISFANGTRSRRSISARSLK